MFHQSKIITAKVLTVLLFCGMLVMPESSNAMAKKIIRMPAPVQTVKKLISKPTIPVIKADLTIQNAKITPAEVKKGGKINIYFELKNIGNLNAENFYVKVSDGQGLGSETWERRLLPRQTKIFNLFFDVAEFQLAGEHAFTIFADSRANIMESNENNNTAQVKVNVIDAKGTIAILMPNVPAPNQVITPSTADAITDILASRFKVVAATENFQIKTLTLKLSDPGIKNAIRRVAIKYPASLTAPYILDGEMSSFLINADGTVAFDYLDFFVNKNSDMPTYFEVYFDLNPVGQGTNGGEVIRFDFYGTGPFTALGLSSGNSIVNPNDLASVEGSPQTISRL